MNCSNCQHNNPAQAKFCLECGTQFALTCSQCQSELPPSAKFCLECGQAVAKSPEKVVTDRDPRDYTPKHLADKILTTRAALEGERKDVTVMFADIKGSMELAGQLDPERWHEILDEFFAILNQGVHRFEGTINQYTGDGVMALFGAPISHEDHAQRACYAALDIRKEVGVYADKLRIEQGLSFAVRIGINSGDVVVGKIGDDLRMDYTAQGHTVGLAQRIEQLAEPGRVYVSEHTQRRVAGYFNVRSIGESRIAGSDRPTGIFELEAVGSSKTRIEVSQSRGLTHFVGRADEMSTLRSALSNAQQGNGQVVGVVGDAGLGKSRLCLEFIEQCRDDGLLVIQGHCPAHGKNIPFIPILELYRNYFGIKQTDDPVEARRKIAGALLLLDESLRDDLPGIFEFLGVEDRNEAPLNLDAETRQRHLIAFLHRLYRIQAERGITMVLLVDDLHWIDSGSDAFLSQIVTATIESSSNLLLLNFRPEYHAEWMRRAHYHQLPLTPLTAKAVRELVSYLLGNHSSLEELSSRIVEWTSGNPFYTEEVIQQLVETGHLDGAPGAYRLVSDIEQLEVPVSVRAVLAARIDRLLEDAKRLLQAASIIGKDFHVSLLEAVSGLSSEEFHIALDRLKDGDFIFEMSLYPVIECAFKHPLTQEVASNSQLQGQRAEIHGRVAAALEMARSEIADSDASLLAYHWDEAGDQRNALLWHRRAALWSLRKDAMNAFFHWQRVRVLVDTFRDDQAIVKLGAEACAHLLTLGWRVGAPSDDIEHYFVDGKAFAEASGDKRNLIMLHAGYGAATGVASGDTARYIEHSEEAARLADQLDDPELSMALRFYVAWANLAGGNLEQALEMVSATRSKLPVDGEFGVQIIGTGLRGGLLVAESALLTTLGRFGQAKGLIDDFRQSASSHASPEVVWLADYYECRHAVMDGRLNQANQIAAAMLAASSQVSSGFGLTLSNIATGFVQRARGNFSAGAAALKIALENCDRHSGFRYYRGAAIGNLAECLSAQKKYDEALNYASAGVEFCRQKNSLHDMQPWLALARVNIFTGDESGALATLDELQGLVTKTGARLFQPGVHELRAEFSRKFGSEWSVDHEIDLATGLYQEVGNVNYVMRESQT